MDISDTFPEAQKAATKIDVGQKDPEKEAIIEELKRVRAQLVETQKKVEELSKENDNTFIFDEASDTFKEIKVVEDLTDNVVKTLLGKRDLKLDDLNVVVGTISAMEKYRTMKVNIYSMSKFKYPTGAQRI